MFRSLKYELLVLVGALISFAMVGVSVVVYLTSMKNVEDHLGKRARSIARTIAASIDVADHEAAFNQLLTDYNKMDSNPSYVKIKKNLRHFQKINNLQTEIYTYIKPHWVKDKLMFLVQGQAPKFAMSGIDIPGYLQDAFNEGGAEGFTDIFTNGDGTWITGYAPILKADRKVSGIVEVALSTTAEVRQAKTEFLISLAIAVSVAFVIALLLTWFMAVGIARPVTRLAGTAAAMGDGKLDARSDIKRRDEIGALSDSFNAMAENLAKSYAELEDYSKNLEKKVQEKTGELEKEKNYVTTILQSIGEGLIVIGSDFKVQPGYSLKSQEILGVKKLEGKDFLDLLFPDAEKTRQVPLRDKLKGVLLTAFNLFMPDQFPDIVASAPATVRYPFGGDADNLRTLGLSFAPVIENEEVSRVIVGFSDVTELEALRDSVSYANEKVIQGITHMTGLMRDENDKEAVRGSLVEILPLADQAYEKMQDLPRADLKLLFRELHTVKGGVRSFGFEYLNHFAHEAETMIADLRDGKVVMEEVELDVLAHKAELLHRGLHQVHYLWQGGGGEAGESGGKPARPRSPTFEWDAYRTNLEKSLTALAADLKKKVRISVRSSHAILGKDLSILKKGLLHMLRNSLDHGIEERDVRLNTGKDQKASLTVEAERSEQEWVLRVVDDGAGINKVGVVSRAKEAGLGDFDPATITNEELLKLLCNSGLSTKLEVTDVSGRGVGMDAVAAALEEVGGRIILERSDGSGTAFTLRWPPLEAPVEVDLPSGNEALLIVDDETDLVELLGEAMSALNLKVLTAEGVDPALEILKTNRISVIVTDIAMGDKSGLALISEVTASYPETRIIVLSGHADADLIAESFRMGVSDFINKPADLKVVCSAVERALLQRQTSFSSGGSRAQKIAS